MQIFQNL